MPKLNSKNDLPSEAVPTTSVKLKGAPTLLKVAWVTLFIWILLLLALALHVIGVW